MNLYKIKSFLDINSKKRFKFVFIFTLVLFSIVFNACQSSKFLKPNTFHLVKNKLIFKGEINNNAKSRLSVELSNLFLQKENGHFLYIFPSEYIYYKNTEEGDTTGYNRFYRNTIGEKPSIFDLEKTKKTADILEKYLINKKGYYNAEVKFKTHTDSLHKKVKVRYIVDLQKQYSIEHLSYQSEDNSIMTLINQYKSESFIHEGDPIDETNFSLEKSRISNLLQNKGYASFNSNYIRIKGDSTLHSKKVDVLIYISSPSGSKKHDIYTNGTINIHTDYNQTEILFNPDSLRISGIQYYKKSDQFLVKPNVINSFVYLIPGQLYNNSEKQKTYRKLSELATYQYVNINARLDTENKTINFDIYLTPFTHKWVGNIGGDLYYSNSSKKRLGVSGNNNYVNKNLFGGAEQFFFDVNAGLEFQFTKNGVIVNQNINVQSKIEFPKHLDILGEYKFLNLLNILSDSKYKSIKEETTSEFKVGYNYLRFIALQRLHKFNLSFGYNYQPSIKKRIYYEPTAFILYNQFPSDSYQQILDKNPYLKKSLARSFISGLIFSNLSYNISSKNKNGHKYNWYSRVEVSGAENYLYNQIASSLKQNHTSWDSINQVRFSRFAKFETEIRYGLPISEKSSLATRVGFGIASPFSSNDIIPFQKQFFIGGPNSLRAWSEREIGPGAYSYLLINPEEDLQFFYQTGDILFEANIEYRVDIIENTTFRLELATFLDAGNIWTLKKDAKRINSEITSKFYNQIAVGTGWGIRLDFHYFLLRADFAYKLRNPYPNTLTGKYWDARINGFGQVNFAINHPF